MKKKNITTICERLHTNAKEFLMKSRDFTRIGANALNAGFSSEVPANHSFLKKLKE